MEAVMEGPFSVLPGHELEVAQALAGPGEQREPLCPDCGGREAERLMIHRETAELARMACYLELLDWEKEKGCYPRSPTRRFEDMPRTTFNFEVIRSGRRVLTSVWANAGVRCVACGYVGGPEKFWG